MSLTAQDIEPALPRWPEVAGGTASLINHSENQTFRIEAPGQGAFTLRVHRSGYQSEASIRSELAWLAALRRDTTLNIPEPVPGADGQLLQCVDTPAGPRNAVLFRFIAGREPRADDDLGDLFVTLGQYAATMHNHVAAWRQPDGFQRPRWQAATILDVDAPWGDWRMAPGVNDRNRPVLDRLDAALWQRLAAYGTGPDRYGLIHADMRLGNILVDGNQVALIDFDDCGFCWFAYDFAAAISFHETRPDVPVLREAWLRGYQTVRQLDAADIAAFDSMIMLRRMALLAWIGSHADTALARQHMPGFADGTAELAERYLRGPIWS
ncbi:MAG TPA: phosphotransferase [Devosia sp.]|jgi:Ser/Thr protein kinase RdoA (MazF antagonist)|nr:phosphotransferase [Devosia sp.]